MNWRRGLFRLWTVGTALFVIAVAFVSYGDIKEEFEDAASATLEPPNRFEQHGADPWAEFRIAPKPVTDLHYSSGWRGPRPLGQVWD